MTEPAHTGRVQDFYEVVSIDLAYAFGVAMVLAGVGVAWLMITRKDRRS